MNGLRRNNAEEGDAAGTTTMPSVAIVILNWNGKAYLQQFLPFVLAGTYANKRVIVADNNSIDGSVIFLKEHFPEVKLLQHTTNEGFAKGYNSALKQVTADYYILLNNDVEVTPGWMEPIISLMESDASIAACQPKILSFHQRNYFEYAGACGGWIDHLGYPFSRGRVFDTLEPDAGQYDDAQACFWASGAAFFVRANCYHEVGGLDEYFFAHQEEIDLCWRLQLAGYKIFVQPLAVVYHVGGGTLAKDSEFKTYLNFRNNLIMYVKNMPMAMLWWRLPLRLALDGLAAWKELFGAGNRNFFVAVCKSHVGFVKWVCFHKHRSVFSKRRAGSLTGWFSSAVVWQYFVKKKKRFSEIVSTNNFL